MPKKNAKDERIDELTQDLQRVQADFVNYKRRAESERLEIMAMAKQEVMKQLLPILDNIDRGLAHLPEELLDNDWAKGVQQVAKQAEEMLKSIGIERIISVGERFDPHQHEAISQDGEGDTVTEELQPGYRMGDKVIRHSMVKVGQEELSNEKENN
jgi:molecular chaperone GrpE